MQNMAQMIGLFHYAWFSRVVRRESSRVQVPQTLVCQYSSYKKFIHKKSIRHAHYICSEDKYPTKISIRQIKPMD